MFLLIFSSANKIAQGVIRRLHASANFEKIVCADLYPNYSSIQRFLNFKSQLGESTTQLTDIKITDKWDLKQAVEASSHILYITHDYYKLVPSKISLIKNVAEIAKKSKNVERLVALTPIEHDHYEENNPALVARKSEEEAAQIYDNLVHLRSDITFGPDSTLVNILLNRIANNQNISFQPRSENELTSPIHTDDVAKIVEAVLKDKSIKDKAYALQGPDQVTLGELLSHLQKAVGKAVLLNQDHMERFIAPYQSNIMAEYLYDPSYRNAAGFLRQYKTFERIGLESISSFKIDLKSLSSVYQNRSIDVSLYKQEESSRADRLIKNFLYL